MLKTGPALKPTDKPTKSFEGKGKRASGRASIGTVRTKQQAVIDQQASDLLSMKAPEYDAVYQSTPTKTKVDLNFDLDEFMKSIEDKTPRKLIKSLKQVPPFPEAQGIAQNYASSTLKAAAKRAIKRNTISSMKAKEILGTMTPSTTISDTMRRPVSSARQQIQSYAEGIAEQEETRRRRDKALYKIKVQDPAAARIQAQIRRHHELDKSIPARVERMTNELTRSEGNINQLIQQGQQVRNNIRGKRASTIQAAIRRIQPQLQYRTQRIEGQITRLENRMEQHRAAPRMQAAARASTIKSQKLLYENRSRNPQTPEAVRNAQENIDLMDQITMRMSTRGRPRIRNVEGDTGSMVSTASTVVKGAAPKKK